MRLFVLLFVLCCKACTSWTFKEVKALTSWWSLLSCFQVQPMVLLKHHQQFEEWHNRWLEENVTMEAVDVVQDWLMGDEDEEMVPCKTTCETVNVHGVPVNRYRVQYSRRPASPWGDLCLGPRQVGVLLMKHIYSENSGGNAMYVLMIFIQTAFYFGLWCIFHMA